MRVFQDRADCCSECLAAGRATIQPKAGLVLCLLFGFDLVSLVMLTMRADRFASGPAPRFKQLSRFIFIGVFLCSLIRFNSSAFTFIPFMRTSLSHPHGHPLS